MTNMKKTKQSQSVTQSNPVVPPPVAPTPEAASPPAATASAPPATAPDPNTALEQYVQQTVAQLDTVEVGLGDDPPLTPALKRHALKFRKGGDKIIGQIGNLAQQQQLESPGLNVTDMLATLGKAQALQPLFDRVAAFAKHVDDVVFKAESDSLSMAQQFYALLQRRALTDGELATAMVPVVTFFARKPVPKAAGALTKPQKKATKKAVETLQKNAPQMLQDGSGAAGGGTAGQVGTAPAAAGATAPAAGGGTPAVTGNGAQAPVAPTATPHS
jgi:hypothetical protein